MVMVRSCFQCFFFLVVVFFRVFGGDDIHCPLSVCFARLRASNPNPNPRLIHIHIPVPTHLPTLFAFPSL